MAIQYLETLISLPPGLPSSEVMRELLRLMFEKFRWFPLVRYGTAAFDERMAPGPIDYRALLDFYEERKELCAAARTDRDFLCIYPAKPDVPPYVGHIVWVTSPKAAAKASWRAAHAEQVAEVMRLVKSPLAMAGTEEDLDRKSWRWIPEASGRRRTFTVRDYSEGLAGLFWRNFYGPTFVRLFGERLASLPEECRRPLGEELVLVQPYELPTAADTEEGARKEQALISHLGPECFYDHERHTPPTRRPVLAHLAQPLH